MNKKKEYRGSQIPSLIIGISTMLIGILQAGKTNGTSKNISIGTAIVGTALTGISIKRIGENEEVLGQKNSLSTPDEIDEKYWRAKVNEKKEGFITR